MLPASPISPGLSPYHPQRILRRKPLAQRVSWIGNSDISAFPQGKKIFDQSFDLDVKGH